MSAELTPLFTAGINKHFGLEMKEHESPIGLLFHSQPTDSRVVDMQGWSSYTSLPEQRYPGEDVTWGTFAPSYGKRFIVDNYSLGDFITQEDWDDDQYGVLHRLLPSKGGALAQKFGVLEETVASTMFTTLGFNTASSTSVAGSPDGGPLFWTTHPISKSTPLTTAANRPTADVDLSIASYQVGASNLRQQLAPDGLTILNNSPALLVINPNLHYVAKQILQGEWERGTTDRNRNFIPDDNVSLVEWPYLRQSGATGTWNAWFQMGQTHHCYFVRRQNVQIKTDYSINNLSYVFVAWSRFTLGWSDWRGTYGSRGA